MSEYQCVVCDLDGTLLNDQKKISNYTKDVIKQLKQAGLLFGIATGRSVDIVLEQSDAWQIKEAIDFIIGMNGCQIYHNNNKMYERITMLCNRQIKAILAFFFKTSANYYLYDSEQRKVFCRRIDSYSNYILHVNQSLNIEICNQPMYSEIEKILILDEPEKINMYLKNIQQHTEWQCKGYKTLPFCIEIVNDSASKANGLAHYCNKYGIKLSSVIAFGDQMNDIELLETCGKGIVMKNACDSLKSSIKEITDFNHNENGIALYLNQLFFDKKQI